LVVEFIDVNGHAWVGNFQSGIGAVSTAIRHPDGQSVLVVSKGDIWSVDPDKHEAELIASTVDQLWSVHSPDGFIFSWQGMAFFRISPFGTMWQTRRLSWDGFYRIELDDETLSGLAWNPDERWYPFSVSLATGASTGGSYGSGDEEGWEKLTFR
jgi:hypothetical protein